MGTATGEKTATSVGNVSSGVFFSFVTRHNFVIKMLRSWTTFGIQSGSALFFFVGQRKKAVAQLPTLPGFPVFQIDL